MIVFVLMAIRITTTLFSISTPSLSSFSASSIPMLLVWITDHSSTELFAFKSAFWVVIYSLFFLAWLISPWLTISNRRAVVILGLSIVIGLNLFDTICCILSALPILEKTLNLFFSIFVIGLSIRAIVRHGTKVGSVIPSQENEINPN